VIRLTSMADLDDVVRGWLVEACDAASV
jgi:hypothetical protein